MDKMISPERNTVHPDFFDHASMYEVSGHEYDAQALKRSQERYLRDKQQDEAMRALVQREVPSMTLGERIEQASFEERIVLIRAGLANPDPEVQKIAAQMIVYAPQKNQGELRGEVSRLVRTGLANPNPEVQKHAAEMIRYAPPTKKPELFLLAKQQLGDRLVEPRLYRKRTVTDNRKAFQRTAFEKTGSETTLLGGTLKAKIIIRHIEPKAFLAWQKIFEDCHSWQEAGFDYVPVEPIQSYRLGKDGKVDVYSGVLDMSFDAWMRMTDDFVLELYDDKEKIEDVLEKRKIIHGHRHEGNYCLRFFRDQEGHVDFTRKPHLYLIDFDKAVSP